MVLTTHISMVPVQGGNVKMASIIETSQVVVVLALLPLILLCLMIIEPFDHMRFHQPRFPRIRTVRRQAKRARPVMGSELA